MPDQSSAADEHALIQEVTAPLSTLPDDPVPMAANVDFPIVLRGYDRIAVDAYVKQMSQLVAELQATRSPEAAVRRALERVGEQISGILQRAHDTAAEITAQSRREAEDRLEVAREEARQIAADGVQRVKDLDADADRIWAERLRIVEDVRDLAAQLSSLAASAADRFPPAEEAAVGVAPPSGPELFDGEREPPAAGSEDPTELQDSDLEGSEDPTELRDSDLEGSEDPTALKHSGAEPEEPDDPDPTAVLPPVGPVHEPLPPAADGTEEPHG